MKQCHSFLRVNQEQHVNDQHDDAKILHCQAELSMPVDQVFLQLRLLSSDIWYENYVPVPSD